MKYSDICCHSSSLLSCLFFCILWQLDSVVTSQTNTGVMEGEEGVVTGTGEAPMLCDTPSSLASFLPLARMVQG